MPPLRIFRNTPIEQPGKSEENVNLYVLFEFLQISWSANYHAHERRNQYRHGTRLIFYSLQIEIPKRYPCVHTNAEIMNKFRRGNSKTFQNDEIQLTSRQLSWNFENFVILYSFRCFSEIENIFIVFLIHFFSWNNSNKLKTRNKNVPAPTERQLNHKQH